MVMASRPEKEIYTHVHIYNKIEMNICWRGEIEENNTVLLSISARSFATDISEVFLNRSLNIAVDGTCDIMKII